MPAGVRHPTGRWLLCGRQSVGALSRDLSGSKRLSGRKQSFAHLGNQADGRRNGDVRDHVRGILEPQAIFDQSSCASLADHPIKDLLVEGSAQACAEDRQ